MEAPANELPEGVGAACAEALPSLPPQDQSAVISVLLRNNYGFVSRSEKVALIDELSPDAARRLRSFTAILLITDEDAEQKLDELIAQSKTADDRFSLIFLTRAKAEAAGQRRDYDTRAALLREALAFAREENFTVMQPIILYGLADTLRAQGQNKEALQAFVDVYEGYVAQGLTRSLHTPCTKIFGLAQWLTVKDEDILAQSHPVKLFLERDDAIRGCVAFGVAEAYYAAEDKGELADEYMTVAGEIFEREKLFEMMGQLRTQQSRHAINALDYISGIRRAEEAIEYARMADTSTIMPEMLMNIAYIHSDLKNPEKAIDYYQRALRFVEISKTDLTTRTSGLVYLNMGYEYGALEDWPKALELYELATEKLDAQSTRVYHGFLKLHHAIALHALGRWEEALPLARQAAGFTREYSTPDNHDRTLRHGATLAWLSARQAEAGNETDAITALREAVNVMDTANMPINVLTNEDQYSYWRLMYAEEMSTALTALDQPAEAVPYLQAAVAISQEQFKTDNMKALANMELQFELRDKDRALTIMQQENELTALELQAARMRNFAFGVGAALIILVCGLLYRSYRIQRNLVGVQNTLLREIQHRIKNNFQVLSSLFNIDIRRAEKVGENTSVQREASNRARTMAILHDRLYEEKGASFINARDLMSDLLELLEQSLERTGITVIGDFDAVRLDADTATPLGLLVSELVTNAYKHAFETGSGAIRVSLKAAYNNTVDLVVEDNGKGFDTTLKTEPRVSLGLDLVHDLSAQLNAELDVHSGPEGTIWFVKGIRCDGLAEGRWRADPSFLARLINHLRTQPSKANEEGRDILIG